LPFFPIAVEQFALESYDLVISSSSAVAKGVITSPDQLHVCYCHSPMRYAWDMQEQYLAQTGMRRGLRSILIRYVLYRLRLWDVISSNRVDSFVSNSGYIRSRIKKTYRREAKIIYPPVDIDRFQPHYDKQDFYLAASRQVPYKRIDLIVEAFKNMPDKKLVVIGDGPEHNKIAALAGDNVEILGYQPDHGGATETVIDRFTGLHFPEQTTESLIDAIERFERLQDNFNPKEIRKHASSFSNERFRREIKAHIDAELQELRQGKLPTVKTQSFDKTQNRPQ